MVLLPKNNREERAIIRFFKYYNQVNGTSYDINKCEWLDKIHRNEKNPECICVDIVTGAELVIERTMLTGEQNLELAEGAEKFLMYVRKQLSCKLPGVFLLCDWGINAIKFTQKNRGDKITQLCKEILAVAPKLEEGKEISLSKPFPVKLRKEKAHKVKTNCDLVWVPPKGANASNKIKLDRQFKQVLNEANEKFTSYSDKQTALLINIWGTGLEYQEFKVELFKSVEMGEYSNIKHIYLSEGLPDPSIYHLSSRYQ